MSIIYLVLGTVGFFLIKYFCFISTTCPNTSLSLYLHLWESQCIMTKVLKQSLTKEKEKDSKTNQRIKKKKSDFIGWIKRKETVESGLLLWWMRWWSTSDAWSIPKHQVVPLWVHLLALRHICSTFTKPGFHQHNFISLSLSFPSSLAPFFN